MNSQTARERLLELIHKPFDAAAVIEFRVQLAEACADAHMSHIEARARNLMPKDSIWNDFDRRIMLDGFVAEKETELRKLEALYDLADDWFSTGQH